MGRDNNVPSGTLVRDLVDDFRLLDVNDGSFSFLLTAQGGLKGTSKPMFYRCILNENASPPPRFGNHGITGLNNSSLYDLTYDLSYQCKSIFLAVSSHHPAISHQYLFSNIFIRWIGNKEPPKDSSTS